MSSSETYLADLLKNAVGDAFRDNYDRIKAILDRYTLKDTGALINSGKMVPLEGGFSVAYDVDYFDYVFHNSHIHNVTTSGTSPYWDRLAENSSEFAKVLFDIQEEVTEVLNANFFSLR